MKTESMSLSPVGQNPLISARNLCYQYEYKPLLGRKKVRSVLKGLNFDIYPGDMVLLTGANGSGKSTVFKCLRGVRKDYGGSFTLHGKEIKHTNAVFENERIGVMPPIFFDMLTVQENFEYLCGLYKMPFRKEAVLATLKKVDLEKEASSRAYTLSSGQKQRMRLAMALMCNPRLILLDEPGNALDVTARYELWKLLANLNREGCTIILISHFLREVEHFFNRMLTLRDGVIVLDKPIKALIEQAPFSQKVSFNIFALEESAEAIQESLNTALPGQLEVNFKKGFFSVFTSHADAVVDFLKSRYAERFELLDVMTSTYGLEDVFEDIQKTSSAEGTKNE